MSVRDMIKPDAMSCPSRVDGECSRDRIVLKVGRSIEPSPCPVFRCARCRRLVPWCFGGHDDDPHVCDDCAVF